MPVFSNRETVFSSESVCAGHPDKIADQISDAIVDALIKQDAHSRAAVEALVTTNRIILAGEVSSRAQVDYQQIARQVVADLGYTEARFAFDNTAEIEVYIHQQSADIAVGVDQDGAGDQGMMFGYACHDNQAFMPWPVWLSHQLCRKIDESRSDGSLPYLRPDGKAQVGVRYERGIAVAIDSVVVAVPHSESVTREQVEQDVRRLIVEPVLAEHGFELPERPMVINGTGVWHIGGPDSDSGLTGRKIVVDGYGGMARVGGGCFSGKDATKVDRSGAYAARYLAKNIVAARLAEQAEVRLSYAIGQARPLMQEVETFGTAKVSDTVLASFMEGLLDTSVGGIIEGLDLRRPIYRATAAYGHFGRQGFSWEKVVDSQ